MVEGGGCAGGGFNYALCHWQSFGLGFWLPLLFLRLNLCSPYQILPTSHEATCITPRPIYTPKGKPGRKAVVLEDGKQTALWQQSSRGSGRKEEEAAGEQGLPADGRAVLAQEITGSITQTSCQLLFTREATAPKGRGRGVSGAGLWVRNNSTPPSCNFSPPAKSALG